MTPSGLKEFRHSLGLSAEGFARLMRMKGEHAARTVRRWESGDQEIPGYVILVCSLIRHVPGVKQFLKLA